MRRYYDDPKYEGCLVYDADTGERIHGVRWFDDETWEWEQSVHLVGEDGLVMYIPDENNPGGLLSVMRQGGIVVRKPEEAA